MDSSSPSEAFPQELWPLDYSLLSSPDVGRCRELKRTAIFVSLLILFSVLAPGITNGTRDASASSATAISNNILMTKGTAPSGQTNYMDDISTAIANAKNYVYVSMFYLEPYPTNTVINSLQDAVQRGVDVRVAIASQSALLYPQMESSLQAKGIPYKIVSDHAKVVVIDDKLAYIGSANWNYNGLQYNWELTLKTNNPNTIAEAKQYNLNLWIYGKQKTAVLNEYPDERFVSGAEYLDLLIDKLQTAQSVKLLMFEATYDFNNLSAPQDKILNEVKNAYQRGANLQLLFDDPRYCINYGGREFLSQNHIPHKLDDKNTGPYERSHVKAILINDKTLFIGSENWNKDDATSILDASVMTSNPAAISQFQAIFDAKWSLGKWRSDYNPCSKDFSVSASPTALNIVAGQSATSTITVTSLKGFNSEVTLTVSPSLSGIKTKFSSNPVTPPANGSTTSKLTITTYSSAPKGTYSLTITGSTSSTPQHKVTITVAIS